MEPAGVRAMLLACARRDPPLAAEDAELEDDARDKPVLAAELLLLLLLLVLRDRTTRPGPPAIAGREEPRPPLRALGAAAEPGDVGVGLDGADGGWALLMSVRMAELGASVSTDAMMARALQARDRDEQGCGAGSEMRTSARPGQPLARHPPLEPRRKVGEVVVRANVLQEGAHRLLVAAGEEAAQLVVCHSIERLQPRAARSKSNESMLLPVHDTPHLPLHRAPGSLLPRGEARRWRG